MNWKKSMKPGDLCYLRQHSKQLLIFVRKEEPISLNDFLDSLSKTLGRKVNEGEFYFSSIAIYFDPTKNKLLDVHIQNLIKAYESYK